jgi:hypothetical protein
MIRRSKVEVKSGKYMGKCGYVQSLTPRMVYKCFDTGSTTRLMQGTVKVLQDDHSETDPVMHDVIDNLDVILPALMCMGLDDEDIHALVDCCLDSVREDTNASQSFE